MNRKQWYTLSIGFFLFSLFMFVMAQGWSFCSPETAGCAIARYSHGIPAIILMMLGLLFSICGGFEK